MLYAFKQQGFSVVFRLDENCFVCMEDNKFKLVDFKIFHAYEYIGKSDFGDSATIFAIESKSGLKGTLVTPPGIYSDAVYSKMTTR